MTEDQARNTLAANQHANEGDFETALRPKTLKEFVGQERVTDNLSVYLAAARGRTEPLDHTLLSGMPGLGKTTLAYLIAREMDASLHTTSGPALERAGDLVSILTHLGRGDVLFVDEIHRMGRSVQEYLYSAMEDWAIDIMLDTGPTARSVRVTLERFTLVGATTREGLLSAPFRARFGVQERLDPYPDDELATIVKRSSALLDTPIDAESIKLIAARARGTPRVANRILKRIRDVAQVHGDGDVTTQIAERGLKMLGIDAHGLTEMDRRILRLMADNEGPIGLKTIAVAVGEEEDTIEDAYEPHLIRQGLVLKTPRGRTLTAKAREILG